MVRLLPWKGHSPMEEKLPEKANEQNQENGGWWGKGGEYVSSIMSMVSMERSHSRMERAEELRPQGMTLGLELTHLGRLRAIS